MAVPEEFAKVREHLGHYVKTDGKGDYITRFTCIECDEVVEFDLPGFFTRLIHRVSRGG